jgi:hypothetical protein
VDIPAVGLFDNRRAEAARSQGGNKKRLRGPKLVAAFCLAVLVGLGSYAATYKTLTIISASAPATGSVANGGATTTTLPAPAPLPG